MRRPPGIVGHAAGEAGLSPQCQGHMGGDGPAPPKGGAGGWGPAEDTVPGLHHRALATPPATTAL